ncbi:MAG: ABC transporter permease [Bacteriovoracaceae bacterium]|nr:ABC transporter permease [Bacteriovoracaceae bacterium]
MNIYYVAKQTFQEIYQSKILINILFLGIFLLLITFVVSEFSYGVGHKVTLDIGLGALSLSAATIALFLGSTLIQKEIANRTLYMVISRPVSRNSFLTGKMLGLSGILFINVLTLFIILYVFYSLLGGTFNYLIPWSLFYIYLESLLVMFIVVFFSLISNSIIAIFITLTLFVSGHAMETVKETAAYRLSTFLKNFVDNYSMVAPDFSKLNIKPYVLYERFLDQSTLYSAMFYGLFWIILFLLLSSFVMSKKEFS